jgi:CheY-like chemotaxis protein
MNEAVILVAEDNANDFVLLQLAFQRSGLSHKIFRARDGEETLQFLHGQGAFADRTAYPFPKLLLLDLKMPKVGGFDVLERLREKPMPDLSVVVLSSSFLEEDKQRARELGAQDYLVKAEDFDGAINLAKTVHDRWLV